MFKNLLLISSILSFITTFIVYFIIHKKSEEDNSIGKSTSYFIFIFFIFIIIFYLIIYIYKVNVVHKKNIGIGSINKIAKSIKSNINDLSVELPDW